MVKICPNCNEQVRDTDVFCTFCRHRLDFNQKDQSKPIGTILCQHCNVINKTVNSFCESCGMPLEDKSSSYKESTDSYATTSYDSNSHQNSQQTHTYGSYSTYSSSDDRKWYTPPKRSRSAKHPLEWFFWSGWGIYILLRSIFSILFCVLRVIILTRGGRR